MSLLKAPFNRVSHQKSSPRVQSRGNFMKTIEVERTGGPEVLNLQDIGGLEPPGPGQALVRIVFAGVNFVM